MFLVAILACLALVWADPKPTFLQGLSQQAQQEYFQILKNKNETIRQQQQDAANWAQKYGVTTQYNQYMQNQTTMRQQMQQNISQIISQLPQVNQQLNQIMQNIDQTPTQEYQAIEQLRNQTGPAVSILLSFPRYLRSDKDGKKEGRKGPMMGPGPVIGGSNMGGMGYQGNPPMQNGPMYNQYNNQVG